MNFVKKTTSHLVGDVKTRPIEVLFLTQYDETGASSRIRIYQFLQFMPEHNILATIRPLITGDSNKFFKEVSAAQNSFKMLSILIKIAWHFLKRYSNVIEGWSADVVFVQKDVLPFGLLTLLRLRQKNIIYDFDDAIWEENPASSSASFVSAALSWYRRCLLNRILKVSRIVFVDNEYLAHYSRQHCKDVRILSAPIDAMRYSITRELSKATEVNFGWIGSPSTTYLLEEIVPALELLSGQMKIRLFNIGGLPLKSNIIKIDNIPWSQENELTFLAQMHVGLMPLDDAPFNRGRLGYKMVQYLSAGVPIIAADVGLNRTVVIPDNNGVLYRPGDSADFASNASRLIGDKRMLARCSENAVKMARERYHITVQISLMVNAITTLAVAE